MAPDAARRGATALTSAQWHGPQGGAGEDGLLLAAAGTTAARGALTSCHA
jgi:hypothetical protein